MSTTGPPNWQHRLCRVARRVQLAYVLMPVHRNQRLQKFPPILHERFEIPNLTVGVSLITRRCSETVNENILFEQPPRESLSGDVIGTPSTWVANEAAGPIAAVPMEFFVHPSDHFAEGFCCPVFDHIWNIDSSTFNHRVDEFPGKRVQRGEAGYLV